MSVGPGDARAIITRWRALGREAHHERRAVLVAASFTAHPVVPGFGVALHESIGTVARVTVADYNQLFQVCLDPVGSGAAGSDEIVLLWRIEDVFERDLLAWGNGQDGSLDRLLDGARQLGAAVASLAGAVRGSVVASDAPTPVGFGLDHGDPDELHRLVDLQGQLNQAFDEGLGAAAVDRLRLSALQHAVGTTAAFDRRSWLMYRQPFTEHFSLSVGSAIADVIAARTAAPPKVIVLDCDDTLWAGVITDDGIGALQCSDAFPGFAHRSFQIAVQRLRHRGVLLAIASKNDDERVVEAFREVDGMVLTDDDIAARRVSWDPKPSGVAEMATELNLGLDAFVFVDDSTFEIGSMRTQLPMVRSLQVPEQVEALPDLLAESGWFRHMRVTADDRARTGRMAAESDRTAAATAMSNDEFLASLDLHVTLVGVGPNELGRVTQLTNKTNQFNVTTVRRSEADIAALVADPDAHVYAVEVHDRFGEYGIVGVVIARRVSDHWDLDTVLMSCRVLGRGVETAMLASVIGDLRDDRVGDVIGHHVDSGRNQLVASLFPDHGFEPITDGATAVDDAAGPTQRSWVLRGGTDVAIPDHITVVTPPSQ